MTGATSGAGTAYLS